MTNTPYIFVANSHVQNSINQETPNKAFRKMGFDKDSGKQITLHGFRGTFRSLAETYQKEHGATFEVKEAVLDYHVGSKIVKAYNHEADYFEQIKELLEWWSGFWGKL